MTSGVYIIRNLINGKVYVGSSFKIEKRWRKHIFDLRHRVHSNSHLQRSFDKHGEESFSFDVLEETTRPREREQHWIDHVQPFGLRGFNVWRNVLECRNRGPLSAETKARIGAANRGRKYGPPSDEHRAKLSAALKGRPKPPHVVASLLASSRGRVVSEETRRKIGDAGRNRVVSAETRLRLSAARTGRKVSPETREKIAASLKGRRRSAEAIANIRRGRWGR